jgi:hypothetical protein
MPHWVDLPTKQFGTYVEYLAKLYFVRLGADIYLPEIDNKGIDFVVRMPNGAYLEIQVKGRRQLKYFFVPKSQFPENQPRWMFLALFLDKHKEDGEYFLIPVGAWATPNALFKDYPYVGKKSEPEWGLRFSPKNLVLLEPHRFPSSLDLLRP